jgi:hypothetical protein
MTQEQIDYYSKAASDGSVADDKNPVFMLQMVHSDLLVGILRHDFDVVELAKYELKMRGLNQQGEWVGFIDNAHQTKKVKRIKKGRRI